MAHAELPLIDIAEWRSSGPEDRAASARNMDAALQDSGFLLVTQHGIDPTLTAAIRESAARFFALSDEEKGEIVTTLGGRGWIPMGLEANSFYGEESDPTRVDMKESINLGRNFKTGDPQYDARWFADNRYPRQFPDLAALCDEFADKVRDVFVDLLRMCALALDLDEEFFASKAYTSSHIFRINHYPPVSKIGQAKEGQFRVGAHTDWGILTILDRQPGYGGLQLQTKDGEWVDAPYEPRALTVNIGDMMARWVGDRWQSTRHRVLPPPIENQDEDLISLILFLDVQMDTVIAPLIPGTDYEPVVAADYLIARRLAATVTQPTVPAGS